MKLGLILTFIFILTCSCKRNSTKFDELNIISSSSLEDIEYYEYSLNSSYNYPKMILTKFSCEEDTFSKLIELLKVVKKDDSTAIKKNKIYIADQQNAKFFWSLTPEFFPNGKQGNLPSWWSPCSKDGYAYYFLANKPKEISIDKFNGKVNMARCNKEVFMMIQIQNDKY